MSCDCLNFEKPASDNECNKQTKLEIEERTPLIPGCQMGLQGAVFSTEFHDQLSNKAGIFYVRDMTAIWHLAYD